DMGRIERPRARGIAKGFVRGNRSLGNGSPRDRRSAGGALCRILRGIRELGLVAGAAFARRPHSRDSRGLSLLPRGQRLHGARLVALLPSGFDLLDSGLSLFHLGTETPPAGR